MSNHDSHGRDSLLCAILGCLLPLFFSSGCASDSHAARGAEKGATTGAVAGAVGGLVSGLVFGGDPVERAAQGAVYGGTTGAVAGAMAGSEADKREAEQREKQRTDRAAELREELGEEAFQSLASLAECKHQEALETALRAQELPNPNHALAGLWLEVLIYADQKDEARARELFGRLVEADWDIENEAQAEEAMREALNGLMDIREEYGLPRVCS